MVLRLRLRYARRGRLRFASHRDFARALERAVRRAGVPVAYSAGFSPHPKISYASAPPTGVASEAEYFEIAVTTPVTPQWLREELDAALPAGFDILDCVVSAGGSLADRIDASHWLVELPGAEPEAVAAALRWFLDQERVEVERSTRSGRRRLDARGPVVRAGLVATDLDRAPSLPAQPPCAILEMVVRQATPAVRPDDVLTALRSAAALVVPAPPRATRLAQGLLDGAGRLVDPLGPDRRAALAARESDPEPASETAYGVQ